MAVGAPARLRADDFARLPPIRGFGPDAQITGGGGFGLGRSLDNNFLGRARLGLLYAYEPWLVSAGVTGEVGALAGLGVGAELELNHFDGAYAQLGLARAQGVELMSHVAVGYTIFGMEWQQRFTHTGVDHALLAEVRLPLGMWWFFVGHDKYKRDRQKHRAELNASATNAFVGEGKRSPPAREPEPGPSADDRYRAEKALERARLHTKQGEHALAAEAFTQAYALDPDPLILVRRADAEVAQGKLVLATRDLQRFLQLAVSAEAMEHKSDVSQRVQALSLRLAQLRLSCSDARGDELVLVDAEPAPGLLLGYDLPLDPGSHVLVIRRGDTELLRRELAVVEGQIVRVEVALAQGQPAASGQPLSVPHNQ
ncbi:MAG TPA: hypothetical protein VF331_17730 [Polyangiales bacterium]